MVFIPSVPSTVIEYSHTATDDNAFRLIYTDLWVEEVNVHVETNNAKYGNATAQNATITTNQVPYFRNFNLADLFFKNATAGSNTTIRVVGIAMQPARMKEVGLI